MAERSSTATKWITFGVPNALSVSGVRGTLESAARVITTNMRPVRAAPEEPTMT